MVKLLSGIFRVTGIVLKVAFIGALLIGNFVMNCVGVLICAITSQN